MQPLGYQPKRPVHRLKRREALVTCLGVLVMIIVAREGTLLPCGHGGSISMRCSLALPDTFITFHFLFHWNYFFV